MNKAGTQAKFAAGFTIIETMIVLAVTGALFVAIAATLSGRQNSAEFNHAIQSAQAQIQSVIYQVEAGDYNSANNFTCTDSGGQVAISKISSAQGTNAPCVFLGKIIQFGVKGTGGSGAEQYRVYTVAGLRSATAGSPSPFQNADPTVVGVPTGAGGGDYGGTDSGLTSYSDSGAMEYGLSTLWVKSVDKSGRPMYIDAVGFLMEPGSLNTNNSNNYNYGTQQVDLIPIPAQSASDKGVNNSMYSTATNANSRLGSATLARNPAAGVQICLVSGGTNESGLVTIGGGGAQLTVTLAIKSDKTCDE